MKFFSRVANAVGHTGIRRKGRSVKCSIKEKSKK